jgi:xanthine dehydrogenase iron-sulfur cluster and FAD-binding subunit A
VTIEVTTVLNGRRRSLDDEFDLPLLDWLRERIGLLGAKLGCGEGRCGTCTVLVDGRAILSCLTTAGQVAGRTVTTIEGLVGDPHAEAVMARLAAVDAVQCGFCTPGVVVALTGLAKDAGPQPGLDRVRAALAGNLCRCTGYRPIVEAALETQVPAEPTPRRWGSAIESATYRRPVSLDDALEIRGSGNWTPRAGGTDLSLRGRLSAPADHAGLLDLSGVRELDGIAETETSVRIGAMSTYADLIASALIHRWCRPLADAATEIGGAQVRHQATIGGALAGASPVADALPALAVLGATVEVRSSTATRTLDYRDFVTGPGTTALGADELVTAVVIVKNPAIDDQVGFFRKAASRRAQAISSASAAIVGEWDGRRLAAAAVCFGAVGGAPHVSVEASEILAAGTLDAARVAVAISSARPPIDPSRRRLLQGLILRGCYDVGLLT